VVLLVPAPVAAEVQGLRRALGDPALERIPPHLTLLAPVNVRDVDVDAAVAVVTAAAAAAEPLRVDLGPVVSFAPVTHTVHLAVGGPDLDALGVLRAGVHQAPLARPDVHPWTPHVTLAAEAEPGRVTAALGALDRYRAEVVLDRVHVLVQDPDRVWNPLADAALGPLAPSGRGGFEVAVAVSDGPGPAASGLFAGRGVAATATIDAAVVGAARGWSTASTLTVAEVVVAVGHRGLGVGRRLLASLEAEAVMRGCGELVAPGVDGAAARSFLAGAGWRRAGAGDDATWSRPLRPTGGSYRSDGSDGCRQNGDPG
jgi:2'-5' RNA ligase